MWTTREDVPDKEFFKGETSRQGHTGHKEDMMSKIMLLAVDINDVHEKDFQE